MEKLIATYVEVGEYHFWDIEKCTAEEKKKNILGTFHFFLTKTWSKISVADTEVWIALGVCAKLKWREAEKGR